MTMANMSVMLSIFSSSSSDVEIFRVLAPGLNIGTRIRAVIKHSISFIVSGHDSVPVVICPPLAGSGWWLAGLGPVEEDGESGAGHAPGLGGVAQGQVSPRQPRHPLHRDDDGVVLRTSIISIIIIVNMLLMVTSGRARLAYTLVSGDTEE